MRVDSNPLRPEEFSVKIRQAFDFKTQKRVKQYLSIRRTCLKCGSEKWIPIKTLRRCLSTHAYIIHGLCITCFNKSKDVKGSKNPQWKGGTKLKDGYVLRYALGHPNTIGKSNYTWDHRLVMEKHIGRYLLPGETVHHKNGIKTDNRIENLELWTSNHGKGIRYDDFTDKELSVLVSFLKNKLNKRQC